MRTRTINEIFTGCALSPLHYTDMRAQVDPMVTFSDASNTGGGECRSIGCTGYGRSLLATHVDLVAPRPLLVREHILVFAWFDGVGGLRRSLERLLITPDFIREL